MFFTISLWRCIHVSIQRLPTNDHELAFFGGRVVGHSVIFHTQHIDREAKEGIVGIDL